MTRAEVLRTVAADLDALTAAGTLSRWAFCGGLALAVWGSFHECCKSGHIIPIFNI